MQTVKQVLPIEDIDVYALKDSRVKIAKKVNHGIIVDLMIVMILLTFYCITYLFKRMI